MPLPPRTSRARIVACAAGFSQATRTAASALSSRRQVCHFVDHLTCVYHICSCSRAATCFFCSLCRRRQQRRRRQPAQWLRSVHQAWMSPVGPPCPCARRHCRARSVSQVVQLIARNASCVVAISCVPLWWNPQITPQLDPTKAQARHTRIFEEGLKRQQAPGGPRGAIWNERRQRLRPRPRRARRSQAITSPGLVPHWALQAKWLHHSHPNRPQ